MVEQNSKSEMNALTNIMNILVPLDSVSVSDALGNEYSLRGALPARRQIKVLRHLDKLKTAVLSDPKSIHITDAVKDSNVDMSTLADFILRLAMDEEVLESLSNAFSLAHPEAVSAARSASLDAVGNEEPLDLFPLEEIVAGLLPFFVRLLKRAAEALSGFQQVAATAGVKNSK